MGVKTAHDKVRALITHRFIQPVGTASPSASGVDMFEPVWVDGASLDQIKPEDLVVVLQSASAAAGLPALHATTDELYNLVRILHDALPPDASLPLTKRLADRLALATAAEDW